MTTSKIKSVEFKKKLNYNNVYYVWMENGDEGEVLQKTEPSIGETWNYDVDFSEYGPKINRPKEAKEGGKFQGKGGFSKEPFEERAVSYAYSYCKDWLHGRTEATKEQWVGLANYICDAMISTYKRVKP